MFKKVNISNEEGVWLRDISLCFYVCLYKSNHYIRNKNGNYCSKPNKRVKRNLIEYSTSGEE